MNPIRQLNPTPQGLKPYVFFGFCGTAEAVPVQNLFMQPVLERHRRSRIMKSDRECNPE